MLPDIGLSYQLTISFVDLNIIRKIVTNIKDMARISSICIILISLFCSISYSQTSTQTLVNVKWKSVTGQPATIDWFDSAVDSQNNLIVVGNTLNSEEGANVLVSKYSPAGDLVWEIEWNHAGNQNDYGTSVDIDNINNIYIGGATYNESQAAYDYVVLKYNKYGVLQWSRIFNGVSNGDDIATDILVDSSGSVLVTGGSLGAGSLVDYCTLKYSASGILEWESRYDFTGYYDGAVKIAQIGSHYLVVGASGADWNSWDIASVKYDSNGVQVASKRSSNSGVGFDQPMDLKTDTNGNFYICGKTTSIGNGSDWLVQKLDEDLVEVWTFQSDGAGFDDVANGLCLDANGDVFVTGFESNSSGGQSFVTRKINSVGVEEWVKVLEGGAVTESWVGNGIIVSNGQVIACGAITNNGEQDAFLQAFSANGQKDWSYLLENPGIDNATKVSEGQNNNLIVCGTITNGGAESYLSLKLSRFTRVNNAVIDSLGVPAYLDHQLIISFNPAEVDTSVTNNTDISYAKLSEVISTSLLSEINTVVGLDMKDAIVQKLIPELKSTDIYSTSRDGSQVRIPPYWSSFVLFLPPQLDLVAVQNQLASLQPKILDVSTNVLLSPQFIPNDELYAVAQLGFVPYNLQNTGGIDLEGAWEFEKGREEIKVGILDFGIWNIHPDLSADGTFQGSVVKGGKMFGMDALGTQIMGPVTPEDLFYDPHGTEMAGIVGAISNNGYGIAGVAGGNQNEGLAGVSIYDLNVDNTVVSDIGSFDAYTSCLILAISDTPGFGFGLDVVNISLAYTPTTVESPEFLNQRLWASVLQYANSNSCAIVSARGNSGQLSPISLPATGVHPENYVVSVGASNQDGLLWVGGDYGNEMDLIAPGVEGLFAATSFTGDDEDYITANGSSASAAIVSGIVSLLLGEINLNPETPNNLAPEDIEHLLEFNARDIIVANNPDYNPGYDLKSGHGLVNAQRTLEKVQFPDYKVIHRETTSPLPSTLIIDDLSLDIENIPPNYTNGSVPLVVPNGNYQIDVYQLDGTIYKDIAANDLLLDFWFRESGSLVLDVGYNMNLNQIENYGLIYPFPKPSALIDNGSTILAVGHVIHLTYNNTTEESVDLWIPCELDDAKIGVTLYVESGGLSLENQEFGENEVVCFPNPATENLNVQLESAFLGEYELQIFSSIGALVMKKEINHNQQKTSSQLDIDKLENGVYIVKIANEQIQYQARFSKL
ncbi:MAG: S8 family serine peptidase [Flavobacteriales bacterium]|nr:S8 family serine peptidase [Flavobacteriales bacterium]